MRSPCAASRARPQWQREDDMILIGLNGVTKTYGGRLVLDGLDLQIGDEARIGLVGPNGAGKSTLLRIAAGLDDAYSGDLARKRGLRVAYLPQHVAGDAATPL